MFPSLPEYLGKEGNKLLKLIEEPPANTLFVLVAENEELVLPTILSRCQLVKVPQLQTNDIEKALIERANVAPESARQIAGICEGNYREALQLLQHNEEDWQAMARDWLKFIVRKMLPEQVKWVDEISNFIKAYSKIFFIFW